MEQQNFKNHSRMVPLYHYILWLILLAVLIGSIVNLCHSSCDNFYSASLITALTIAGILTAWFARAFALKAQDRAIRAEENLRHFAATGKLLPSQLRMGQIIALRFAGDDEWLALIQLAIDKNLSSKEIKQQIKNWKADFNRV